MARDNTARWSREPKVHIQKNQPSELAVAWSSGNRAAAVSSAVDVRWFPRADIRWPVVIKAFEASYQAETTNISLAGAFIACREPLRLGESFELIISPPGAERRLHVTACVAWSARSGADDPCALCGMGVRFESISDADRALISDAVVNHHRSPDERNQHGSGR